MMMLLKLGLYLSFAVVAVGVLLFMAAWVELYVTEKLEQPPQDRTEQERKNDVVRLKIMRDDRQRRGW